LTRVFYSRRAYSAAVLLLCLSACARQDSNSKAQRIAIVRFENLGADRSADWIGRAIPVMMEAELSASANPIGTSQLHVFDTAMGARPVSAPGVSAERTQALVAGAQRIAYGDYSVRGSRLEVRLWLEDVRTGKIVKTAEVSTASGDVTGAAAALSRQFSTSTVPYSTRSEACIRAYAEGLESNDLQRTTSKMEEAVAADPDFGPAYRSLAELELQQQKRDEAATTLSRALARPAIAGAERARIQIDAASLKNDAAAKQQALASLTRFEPANGHAWQLLAETAMARRDYAASVGAFHHALQFEPENVALLNQLGYAAAYGGRFDQGIAALQKYRTLRPNDPNALDSMGDLNLMANRYREAAGLYSEAQKSGSNFCGNCDLFKGAMANAMAGDLATADGLYKQFVVARTLGHDANAPLLQSEWLWLTGRRQQAISELQAYARTAESRNDRTAASHAYAGLAVWRLIANQRPDALEASRKALGLADASSVAVAAIANFLSQSPASAAEWESRAARLVPNSAQSAAKDQMLALALLFDRQFEAAKAPLQRLYDTSGAGANEGVPVLLAWCDMETGKPEAAGPLIALTPVPASTGINTFTPVWFPRLFELRANAAAKAGKAEEARSYLDLFHRLSGG
jgi:tetratricopeptide (TPR) repeat protein